MKRICSKCKIEKDITEFYPKKSGSSEEFSTVCKLCQKAYKVEYYKKPENRLKAQEYSKKVSKKRSEYAKKYWEKNKEKRREYYRKRRADPILKQKRREYESRPEVKERIRQTRKAYNSRPEVIEHNREYEKFYREKSPTRKLRDSIQRRIHTVIKKLDYSLTEKVEEILGYSKQELIKHIESQFQPGMTWENHGLHGWHIDHIKPVCTFDFLDGDTNNPKVLEVVRQCWALLNLRPLWAKDNWSRPRDGSDIEGEKK